MSFPCDSCGKPTEQSHARPGLHAWICEKCSPKKLNLDLPKEWCKKMIDLEPDDAEITAGRPFTKTVVIHFNVAESMDSAVLVRDVKRIQESICSSFGYGSDYEILSSNEVDALKSLAWRLSSKDMG